MRNLEIRKTQDQPAIIYENRKGDRYYLCAVKTKTGQTRFVFSRQPRGESIRTVPEGYEIHENVHGQVSLRKIKPSLVSDLEIREVQNVIKAHPHLRDCKCELNGKSIIIYYAPKPEVEWLSQEFGFGLLAPLPKALDRFRTYEAMMRFTLVDAKTRIFAVQRMCYRSSIDGWINLDIGKIGNLAREYMKHIGKESFFELP